MRWRFWRRERAPKASISIGDPNLARLFGYGVLENYSGVHMGEGTTVALSAVFRAVSLLSGTVAMLPLRTLRDTGDGQRQRTRSVFDEPGGLDGPTRFEWVELIMAYLLLHGNAYLLHIYGGAGQIIALQPIHPSQVIVEWDPSRPGGKRYTVSLWVDRGRYEQRELDSRDLTHIMALSLDGLAGMSIISIARNSLGTAAAGDRAAAKMFNSGALVAGVASADEDLEEGDADKIQELLDRSVSGWENSGRVPFIERKIKFTPWTQTAEDMQFLASRQFQIEEIARWFGVPPHLLMQTEKQTSWGTGVETQNRAMGRTVLAPWAKRIEERLSRLLPNPRFVEFDFSGLERPTPDEEIALLLSQIDGALLTINEARGVRNLPPVAGGEVLRLHGTPIADPQPSPAQQADPAGDPATDPATDPAGDPKESADA